MDNKQVIDFDISTLSLNEIVDVYNEITSFIEFIDESKMELQTEGDYE